MVNQFKGAVAEWLCSGLQLRVRRFDSDPRLQFSTCTVTARVAKLVDATDLKSVDLWSCGFKSRPGHQLPVIAFLLLVIPILTRPESALAVSHFRHFIAVSARFLVASHFSLSLVRHPITDTGMALSGGNENKKPERREGYLNELVPEPVSAAEDPVCGRAGDCVVRRLCGLQLLYRRNQY